jgi:catalase (peroxidase I)
MGVADYDAVENSINAYLDSQSQAQQDDFIACAVRLAGHDLMDRRNGAGGSDGCINLDDADNAGLQDCTAVLAERYRQNNPVRNQPFCSTISLADYLVIAGEASMNLTRTRRNLSRVPFRDTFRYGRTTNTACQNVAALPNPERGCPALVETFQENGADSLTWTETAALSGVHTLGRASTANSRFQGHWSEANQQQIFNNNYYHSIIAKGWQPTVSPGGRNQWR